MPKTSRRMEGQGIQPTSVVESILNGSFSISYISNLNYLNAIFDSKHLGSIRATLCFFVLQAEMVHFVPFLRI